METETTLDLFNDVTHFSENGIPKGTILCIGAYLHKRTSMLPRMMKVQL